MLYASVLLPICIGILGFAGWIARGWSHPSTIAEAIEDDEPDRNHGNRR
jgi:hypothetical protein